MDGLFAFLAILLAIVGLDVAALAFGTDSRDLETPA